MVWAEVAKFISGSGHETVDDGRSGSTFKWDVENTRRTPEDMDTVEDFEALRPPYIHAMLAGGLGGTTGDMLMHSLDTVKTRQQGDPHMPPKYTSLGSSYWTILRQEGVPKGLYGGGLPAFLGSFTGTLVFFGAYEFTKRSMLDMGVNPSITYLTAGACAILVDTPLYVPSEVLKTRLQLQGRYHNPYFNSGYNYRGMTHAIREIIKHEGPSALFHGFKATLVRDLPYSALQFAFYEQEQKLAKAWMGKRDIGLPLEILTGASAGCAAGVLTCPLDVVKTRIQTQLHPDAAQAFKPISTVHAPSSSGTIKHSTSSASTTSTSSTSKRLISTSSPSTSLKMHSAATIDASSVISGLKIIYKTEGLAGWFRGVGPRAVWTSIQSGTMLVMYQALLKWFDAHPLVNSDPI